VSTIADLATGIVAGFNTEAAMITVAFGWPESPSRVMLMLMANAVAADMDRLVGSISVGKKADFAVLANDPYVLGRAKLRERRIKGVVFEGGYYRA
jgi:cytosine/adenosine deaminase-related metal-dependent hydrolase